MFDKVKNSIEIKLSNGLKNFKLQNFADELLADYKSSAIPIDFDIFFKKRRIKSLLTNNTISHEAYIEILNNEFQISSKVGLDLQKPKDRFLIAHEIAHTFQYKLQSHKIIDNLFFLNGSIEQEYFSNFIARAILIPTIYIEAEFEKSDESFKSLKQINYFCKKYNVEYKQLILRVLNDLSMFENVVILRFILFHGDSNWKILENFMSENIRHDKKYYIPQKNFNQENNFKNRFPKCGVLLNCFLFNLLKQIGNDEEKIFDISVGEIDDKPLDWFLQNIKNSMLKIHFSKVNDKKYKSTTINFMLKIPS